MRPLSIIRNTFQRVVRPILDVSRNSGLIKTGLLGFWPYGTTDTIGLSVDDYSSLSATWQAIFFTSPTEPVEFANYAALWAAVNAESTLNDNEVLGTEAKAVLVYDESTSRSTLNRALRWLGLDPVGESVTFDGDADVTFDGDPDVTMGAL